MANITGTSNNDTLKDTAGSDIIQGLGGDDTIILSKGGNDNVDGGTGIDTLVIDWSALTTSVRGGSGFFTDDHSFSVNYTGIEKFDVTSGKANDSLVTLDGDDTVSSGAGDDSMFTGKGKATVDGGAGKDLWGADFSDQSKAVVLDISKAGTQSFIGGSETGIEHLSFITGSGDDRITTLSGTAGAGLNDTVLAGGGDDIVAIGGGTDTVDGGAGTDTLVIDYATDTFQVRAGGGFFTDDHFNSLTYAGIEKMDVTSGSAADSLLTVDGDDTIHSGAGNDSFSTAKGNGIVDGGAGDDLWVADFSDRSDAMILDISKAAVQVFAGGSAVNVERLGFTTGAGADRITTLSGEAGAGLGDTISSGAGNDVIKIGGGQDVVDGGAGTDTLVIDYSTATFQVRAGGGFFTDDHFVGVNYVGIEKMDVTSGSAGDNLLTVDGDDTIHAGAGDDSFNTAKGNGIVDGGAGDDLWIADFSDRSDAMILDISQSGLQKFAGGSAINVERLSFVTGTGADRITTLSGAAGFGLGDTISSGGGADIIKIGGGIDQVDGGQGKDTLVADYSTSVFQVRGHGSFFTNDHESTITYSNIEQFDVTGGTVADNLVTGNGRDTIHAGAGDDSFDTLKGKAVVDGGAGNDLWAADFSDQNKAMVLDLSLGGTQSFAGGSETSVERLSFKTGSGDDVIKTLTGAAGAGLADSVSTGAGSDLIRVGGGLDAVDGGAGVDTLVIDYSDATDPIRSGGGFFTDDHSRTLNFSNIEKFNVSTGSIGDNFATGNGEDTVSAGGGDDHFDTLKGQATVDGGAGVDTWGADFSNLGAAVVLDLSTPGAQVFAGGKVTGVEAVDFTLGGLADTVTTLIGTEDTGGRVDCNNDTIRGGGGDDVITVGGGTDQVDGGDGFDRLIVDYSGSGFAVRTGSSFVTNDHGMTVTYANIEDVDLILTHGADKAQAGAGADMLDGGAGRDVLWGGAGHDTFRFSALGDSAVGTEDRIRDFADGADRIDLSSIDAGSGMAGDQAFAFIGTDAFHHVAGELRYERVGHHTLVSGDVDGDGQADFAIKLDGLHALTAASFVL